MLFISDAFAAAPAAAPIPSGGSESFEFAVVMLLMGAVFYFLIIRPQSKKYKDHIAMINAVRKGDRIVTSGGIIATVTKIDAENDQVQVEIADGVKVKIVRSTIASVLNSATVESNDNKKAA